MTTRHGTAGDLGHAGPDGRALLLAARARIADPTRWAIGADALDADGRAVLPWGPSAVRWCAVGALKADGHALDGDWRPVRQRLTELAERLGWSDDLRDVNDRLGHAAVLELFDLVLDDEADWDPAALHEEARR